MREEHEVRDPATAAARLAEIAPTRPDLLVHIAAHPNTYPALLEWLATHGDEQVKSIVGQRRAAAQPPPPPPPPFPAPSPSPVPVGAGTAAAATTGKQQPGRRRRTGLVVGLVAGVLTIAVATGGVLWARSVGLIGGGAGTPEAAAEKLVAGLTGDEPLALLTTFAPSEVDHFRDAVTVIGDVEFGSSAEGHVSESGTDDYLDVLGDLVGAVDVTVDGLAYETEEIAEGVVIVSLVAGTITVDGDPDRIAAALTDLRADAIALDGSWEGRHASPEALLEELRRSIARDVGDGLPFHLDIADQLREYRHRVDRDPYNPFTVVTVDEGGWYVSPLLTASEQYIRTRWVPTVQELRGGRIHDARPYATPEEAVAGLGDGIAAFSNRRDSRALAEALPLAERRLVSLYGNIFFLNPLGEPVPGGDELIVDTHVTAAVTRNVAAVRIDEISYTLVGDGYETLVSFDGSCWDVEWWSQWGEETDTGCLDDWQAAPELGLDEIEIIAVKEDGGWLVSPIATLGSAAVTAAEGVEQLARRGELDVLTR